MKRKENSTSAGALLLDLRVTKMLNNFRSLVLVAVLSSTQVSGSAYLRFDRAAYEASSFVGVSTSAIFPVPNATNAASEYDSYFPDATQVGYPGPTPSKFSLSMN